MKIQYYTDEPQIFSVVRSLNYISLKNLIKQDPTAVHQLRSADGYTPLHTAVYTNSVVVVKALLAGGALPNSVSYSDYTPLELALKTADTDPLIIKELIAHGSKFAYKDIAYYYQRRVEKYAEKMTVQDLTCGLITDQSEVKEIQGVFSKTSETSTSSSSHNPTDLLCDEVNFVEKLLVSINLDKGKENIDPECSTIVENLSGNYGDESEYYS